MFYQQWRHDRDSISPLIIEAVFAIAARLAGDPILGQQWLALAEGMEPPVVRQDLTDSYRTCGFLHGHAEAEHSSGSTDHTEGKGG